MSDGHVANVKKSDITVLPNQSDGVSNHRRLDCLLNRLFGRRLKNTKFRVTGLSDGNPLLTSGIPSQKGQ